jgi:hypothetical protein
MPPQKDAEQIRLCVDMREANKAIERETPQMPTVEEIINDLNGAKIFSKLDLRAGYTTSWSLNPSHVTSQCSAPIQDYTNTSV